MIIDPQKIRPPHFILCFLLSAGALHWLLKPPAMVSYIFHWVDVVLFMFGIIIMISSQKSFARHGTPVPHSEKPSKLVTDGLFKYSRNPMYVAGALIFLGIALMIGTWPFFAAWALMGIVLDRIYIPWEEKRMTELFGDVYIAYKQSTRRWV